MRLGGITMPCEVEFVPNQPEEPQQTITLPDKYRDAIIGITVTTLGQPRLVYSLNRLSYLFETMDRMREEQAQKRIQGIVSNLEASHGGNAPVFVDDAGREPRRIITLNGN